ncbi:hypothetical protein [Bhargavaea cecembensis]|uniref:UPF0738 family protein n=1 Tax=Bhargavaea cecembensis TaxID=394098 RepID=UPI000694DFBF|nr:hypothetical protein [Bhargavaea cecembensis]
MKRNLRIRTAKTGGKIEFILDEGTVLPEAAPAGRMITDTDAGTFIYLLDDGEQFLHIHFPGEVWPAMAEALRAGTDPVLTDGSRRLVLERFADELDMLIFNIEGNDNYGDEFSGAVEAAFHEILGA